MPNKKRVYVALAEEINRQPIGAPLTDTFLEILEILFTAEEAEIASCMAITERTDAEIAQRLGRTAEEIEPLLIGMVAKGRIRGRQTGDKRLFSHYPMLPGLYENPFVPGVRTEEIVRLGKLWDKYFGEGWLAELHGSKTPITRAVPVEEHAHHGDIEILPYESITDIIKGVDAVVVVHCTCRTAMRKCDSPVDICLGLVTFDEGMPVTPPTYIGQPAGEPVLHEHGAPGINPGEARFLTVEEALQVAKRAEEAGLIHCVENVQRRPAFICNCCPCCCVLMRGISQAGLPHSVAHSNYIATVDESLCIGCEDCLGRCQVKAITIDKQTAAIDEGKCLGCGLCVSKCGVDAITLRRRVELVVPPETPYDLYERVLREKGRDMSQLAAWEHFRHK